MPSELERLIAALMQPKRTTRPYNATGSARYELLQTIPDAISTETPDNRWGYAKWDWSVWQ